MPFCPEGKCEFFEAIMALHLLERSRTYLSAIAGSAYIDACADTRQEVQTIKNLVAAEKRKGSAMLGSENLFVPDQPAITTHQNQEAFPAGTAIKGLRKIKKPFIQNPSELKKPEVTLEVPQAPKKRKNTYVVFSKKRPQGESLRYSLGHVQVQFPTPELLQLYEKMKALYFEQDAFAESINFDLSDLCAEVDLGFDVTDEERRYLFGLLLLEKKLRANQSESPSLK